MQELLRHQSSVTQPVDDPPPILTWRDRFALSAPVLALGCTLSSISVAVESRRRRPWLAMAGVPLEMAATMTLQLWWTWPALVFCIWWWAPSSWKWTWIVGFEAGLFGTLWVYSFATALAQFTDSRLIVGTIWIGSALALAGVSACNRH